MQSASEAFTRQSLGSVVLSDKEKRFLRPAWFNKWIALKFVWE